MNIFTKVYNWTKDKTIRTWNWTKNNVRKVLIALGFIAVASAAGVALLDNGNPAITGFGTACDYATGTIILIKAAPTGVGNGRYEAGDVVAIRDGATLCAKYGDGEFLGKSEKTNFLTIYYPYKMSDEQKSALTDTQESTSTNASGQIIHTMSKRRGEGIDYTKFLSASDISKAQSFTSLDNIPQADIVPYIVQKAPDQMAVVKVQKPSLWSRIERKLIPTAFAGTGGTKTICDTGFCDYYTVSDWEAGEQGTLLTPAIGQITSGFHDTTDVAINGWDTSASNYIKIYTSGSARHAGKWDTSKYYIDGTNAVIRIFEDYVWLDGLQITRSAASYDVAFINIEGGTQGSNLTKISNCIIKGTNGSLAAPDYGIDSGYLGTVSYVYVDVWNTIIFYISPAAGRGILHSSPNGVVNAYSDTVIGSDSGFRSSGGGTFICKNCFAGGTGSTGGYSNVTLTTSGSSDTTGSTGLQNIPTSTANFVSNTIGSEDWHITSGSALKDVGTNTSGDSAPLNFTTDIDGDSRPQGSAWDIGADEYVSAGGGTPNPQGAIQCQRGKCLCSKGICRDY